MTPWILWATTSLMIQSKDRIPTLILWSRPRKMCGRGGEKNIKLSPQTDIKCFNQILGSCHNFDETLGHKIIDNPKQRQEPNLHFVVKNKEDALPLK